MTALELLEKLLALTEPLKKHMSPAERREWAAVSTAGADLWKAGTGDDGHYEVAIVEHLKETRVMRVPKREASSPQAAANAAYVSWVVRGDVDGSKLDSVDVYERVYLVDGAEVVVEEDV